MVVVMGSGLKQMRRSFSNHEIVTLAVYLLGGDSRAIDTEDVAVKANEIAPGRFNWRKYPEQINIENVRTFLSDAKKPKNGRYLLGSGKEGWLLTEEGCRFSRKRVAELDGIDLSTTRHSVSERRWVNRERGRMLASEAFSKFHSGHGRAITTQEAEAFFRLDEYVRGEARERKILRIVNIFGEDPELGRVVIKLADKLRKRVRNGSD
jgi:hypothetical protein